MSRFKGVHGFRRRGEIQLGDLVKALAALRWETDEQVQAIAARLGFGVQASATLRRPDEIYDRHRYPDRPAQEEAPSGKSPVMVPPAVEPPVPLPAHALTSRLESLPPQAAAKGDSIAWLHDEDALYDPIKSLPLARHALFPERTNRHILSAAMAVRRPGYDIDLPRLIHALCRREPLDRLPHREEGTLERGCHLLLDYSASMVPFWEDLNALTAQVSEVVGERNTRAYSFDTRPTEARCWTAEGKREPWRADGRPVLAASDLGIQGKFGLGDLDPAWADFTAACAKANSPLVILIPWPKPRWPGRIGPFPVLIHWSPHTSAAMIRRHIGVGHVLRR